ncbi:hypothetical protein D3C72_1640400 [compost metagenome]
MLHLQRGDAGLRVLQGGWRNLCRLQGRIRGHAALRIGLQDRMYKGHGRDGGVNASAFRDQQGGAHLAIIATFATPSVLRLALS